MSVSAIPDLLHGADLRDRLIVYVDYSAHARRLSLRIETNGPDGRRIRALLFDGVVGLHCDPADALAPLDDGEDGEILRCDAKERKTGEFEINLVFVRRRAGERVTQAVSFLAFAARWLG